MYDKMVTLGCERRGLVWSKRDVFCNDLTQVIQQGKKIAKYVTIRHFLRVEIA